MERRSFLIALAPATLGVLRAARAAALGTPGPAPAGGRQGGASRDTARIAGGSSGQAGPDSTAGALWDPNRAGRPIAPRGERDNAEEIKAIEQRLKCTCGCNLDVYTCRTTDFTCGVSPVMHQQVMGMWDDGKTAEEIIAAFMAEHGEAILMAPPKEGFNLVGYFMPFTALAAGLGGLVWFLKRQTRRTAEVAAAERGAGGAEALSGGETAGATPGELERLERELAEFDG